MLGKIGKALLDGAKQAVRFAAELEREGRKLEEQINPPPVHVFDPGGKLGGARFEIDGRWIRYVGTYGQGFSVPRAAVQVVTTTPAGMGKAKLQLVGAGTVLAEVKLPRPWAEKAQNWILHTLANTLEL